MRNGRRWMPSAAWAALIVVLASLPGSALQHAPLVPFGDKVVHALLYGVLAWLLLGASDREGDRGKSVWLVLGGVALFGAVDEWHQTWIPGRAMEAADWAADVVGASLAATLSRASVRRQRTTP